jgi:catechol 2,3-dioxygenase-like lactoylglutathione lyase family enzyme
MITIERIDHIGIRVTERQRALDFYALLGFEVALEVDFDAVIVLKNTQGIELNLIVNGVDSLGSKNILMDVEQKHPGITHVAFGVDDITVCRADLLAKGIVITQGPVSFGDGHVSLFLRDPDKNTLELRSRLKSGQEGTIEGLVFYDPKG